jgi:hypothetical protein
MHAAETPEYVSRAISYNAETGEFVWNTREDAGVRWNQKWPGKAAGFRTAAGYHKVKLNKVPYPAHRLAWVIHYGYWPSEDIDHINGIRHDNRIANLREASRSNNMHNQGKQRNNTSGFKGVSRMAGTKKWIAAIGHAGAKIYLGGFSTKEEAAQAYAKAAEILHREFARTD